MAAPALLLTIRFSTSLPDLELDIHSPSTTTVLSLKRTLRTRLDTRSRLRLIHQGRILPDAASLSSVLRAPPPVHDPKGKAKQGEGLRLYVNCSIGDDLTAEELASEATEPSSTPRDETPATPRRPRPRGFDRLLQSGFSSSEIATLRTQFASIQTERLDAPDGPPSPDTLRGLEDAWIDNNSAAVPTSAANPLEDDLGNMSGMLDVLIRGMMIGFFFPLGAMTWLLRQGLWSEKWQIFVGSGVVLSVTVGVIMGIASDR